MWTKEFISKKLYLEHYDYNQINFLQDILVMEIKSKINVPFKIVKYDLRENNNFWQVHLKVSYEDQKGGEEMFDCKACVNNQICKYADKAEIFKRAVDTLEKQFDICEPFEVKPTCKHFKNAFQGIPREIVE